MRLLLMRHGIAADVGGSIRTDEERPLTEEGRQKTAEIAAGLLASGERIGLIATSPLLRAMQTAEIMRAACTEAKGQPKPRLETWPELEHADAAALRKHLGKLKAPTSALLVGHEPGMSRFAAQLLTGSPTGLSLEFKKAGICALELPDPPGQPDARATLLWHATPKQLRRIQS